jgi:hypothetical protein
MSAPASALQQCFDEVADSAPMALERCLNHVVTELQQAELKTTQANERTELGEAWRELQRHQAAWCKHYPEELRAAFGGAKAPTEKPADGMLELALVDDDEILRVIESSRLVQHVTPLVERPVSELDALLSSAMGLATVKPEMNPVRPEVFAQSLRILIGRAQVKPATGTLWMRYMAEPLGHELQDLYGRLVVQLKDANVQAAEYRLNREGRGSAIREPSSEEADREAHAADSVSADAAPQGPAIGAAWSSRQISHALLRDFLATGGGTQAAQLLPPSHYAEVDRELARLHAQSRGQGDIAPPAAPPAGYRELAPVDRPQIQLGVQSTLNSQVWGDYAQSHERSLVRTQLRKDATRVAQVLGLELVRKVVNQIAQDPRLLAPVREAIVALEPSLLRLAMVDPRFFSEEDHPGRRLMECVAQRSFKYNDEFSAEFVAFFDGIGRGFNALNQAAIVNAQPFEQALAELEEAWARQDQFEADPRVQALKAMRFAEQRQAMAEQISWDMSARTDLEGVPEVVQAFLFGPWALVLAHARLTDARKQPDPHGYIAAISDLLWSVKPEVTLRQPALLFERVPSLLAKLRAGLALLGQQPEENEAFFQDLMKLHRPALKLRRAKSRRDARESGVAPLTAQAEEPLAPVAPVQAPAKAIPGQPWMSPRELDALGFEETLPTGMGELPEDENMTRQPDLSGAPQAEEAEQAVQSDAEIAAALAQLREGDWVDLYSKRKWLRAQVVWASTRGTLFMFVSQGGQPHSMTKRVCERLMRERYLRPVRMHGVVAHALGALEREDAPT